MIQVLAGEKGSGKTKKMISLANELILQSKGHIVFISNNSESIFDLDSKIRLIDISQFSVSSVDSFVGFIYGVISEDYDIETIYIDNLNGILKDENEAFNKFFQQLKVVSEKSGIKFVLGAKCSEEKISQFEIEYIAV